VTVGGITRGMVRSTFMISIPRKVFCERMYVQVHPIMITNKAAISEPFCESIMGKTADSMCRAPSFRFLVVVGCIKIEQDVPVVHWHGDYPAAELSEGAFEPALSVP
jgi:hypothetical protein